jgi:glyoxylase-like metal-dependent hydrolase (beta-lactamase superfamily II)
VRILAALVFCVALPVSALEPLQVAPGVYVIQGATGIPSRENRGHTSNAGFVVTTDGVVVFDALGTPALGQELLDAIRRITPQPVRRVIVSHYHADHIYGLAAFKAAGAQVWALEAGRAYLTSDIAKQRLEERRATLGLPEVRLVPADRWLAGEIAFRLGNRGFRLIPVGPAHTPEDLAMSVEEDGVLFVGDLMFTGRLPFVGDADSRAWIAAIDRVIALRPRILVGGHGAPSRDAAGDLRLTRDYLAALRDRMGAAARALDDFDAAYAKADWSRFAALPGFAELNRRNAYNTYIRMQGEPD